MHKILAKAYLPEWIGSEVFSCWPNDWYRRVCNVKGNIGRPKQLTIQK